jgi:hypothetical protein
VLREVGGGGGGSIHPTNSPMFGALSLCVLVQNCFVGEQEVLCGRNNGKRMLNVVRQYSSNICSTLNVNMYCVTYNTMAENKKTSALFYPENFLEGRKFKFKFFNEGGF